MKVFALAPLFLAATSAALADVYQVIVQEDAIDVPGKNPLSFCKDSKVEDFILELKSVDLDPNPPLPGQNLTITAKGTIGEDIEEGAKVHLQIKYGLITIIKQTADLCNTVEKVDLACPLKKGDAELTKQVSLPAQIPPGKYTVLADVFTKDDRKITCLTATVEFHKAGLEGMLGGFM